MEEWRGGERDAQKSSRKLSRINLIYCRESQEYENRNVILVVTWALVSLCVNVDENAYFPGLLWDFI